MTGAEGRLLQLLGPGGGSAGHVVTGPQHFGTPSGSGAEDRLGGESTSSVLPWRESEGRAEAVSQQSLGTAVGRGAKERLGGESAASTRTWERASPLDAEEKSLAECRSRNQSTSQAWSAVESGG
jgi:hypothetical protein